MPAGMGGGRPRTGCGLSAQLLARGPLTEPQSGVQRLDEAENAVVFG